MNTWKISIVIPLLAVFVMNFNTTTIAQTSGQELRTNLQNQQNILKFVVTMNTSDAQLNDIQNKLAKLGATINFKRVKRNTKQEITGIKIKMDYKNTSLNHSKSLSAPISPIEITMNRADGTIEIQEQRHRLSQTFIVEPDKDADNMYKEPIIEIRRNENAKPADVKDLKEHSDEIIQESDSDKIKHPPLYILDGKEITKSEMDAISPSNIDNIEVMKDKVATKIYGQKGEHGVIVITSKRNSDLGTDKIISKADTRSSDGITPMYILNDKEISHTEMTAIDPDTIDSVFVLKNKNATDKYGEKGKNGVIIIRTKKK